MSRVVWNGPRTLTEDVLRYRWGKTATGITCTRFWWGPLGDVHAAAPDIGERWEDVPGKPFIDTVQIVQAAPGCGEMTVTASVTSGGGASSGGSDADITYELEWTQLIKPLAAAKRYIGEPGVKFTDALAITPATSAQKKAMGDEKFEGTVGEWATFIRGESTKNRNILMELTRTAVEPVWLKIKDYFAKLDAGQESFIIPAPVARITTRTSQRPGSTQMGKIGPPGGFPELPAGYQWLGTADRALRQGSSGKWERVREWTGADKWDNQIYTA